MARRFNCFLYAERDAAWKLLFDAHEQEAQGWRRVEASTKARAQAGPEELLYLTYDDTSALGLPKFTNRTLKNLGTTRFDVIPFNLTNNSTNENVYVYTQSRPVGKRAPTGFAASCTFASARSSSKAGLLPRRTLWCYTPTITVRTRTTTCSCSAVNWFIVNGFGGSCKCLPSFT